jgi:nitric-oxide synthase
MKQDSEPSRRHHEAVEFMDLCAHELPAASADWQARRAEVEATLAAEGVYALDFAELEHGGRVAWRNNARCIGRLFWSSLKVRDRRELDDPDLVAADLREHVRLATHAGKIQPLLTVYAPADAAGPRLRIWNHQLFGYAGYGLQEDGSYLGDPKNERFTAKALELGWQPARTHFDLLPWILQKRGEAPRLFEPPTTDCLEVPLRHPKLEWFAALGLRWYAVPILSDMNLRIGGMDFPAAPFNGWYMGTEIGSRDLGDAGRYNVLPTLAEHMGLLRPKKDRLWKDRALVELNEAVLHSFAADGVRIVDHHRASSEFMRFVAMEQQQGRLVSGNWSWLVPPMSGSATEVFHRPWKDRKYVPDYQLQAPAWEGF